MKTTYTLYHLFPKTTTFQWNYHQRNIQGYLQGRARYTTGSLRTRSTPQEKWQYCHNMHSSQMAHKRSKYMPKTYTIYRLICLKRHDLYIGSTIRLLYIRINEHLNTRASSFHKHLIKCKNNNNFPLKIEAIVRNE